MSFTFIHVSHNVCYRSPIIFIILNFSETHTNEKPQRCSDCDLCFTHSDYLSEHRKEKHPNTDTNILSSAKRLKASNGTPSRSSSIIVMNTSNGSMNSSITPKMEGMAAYTPTRGRRPATPATTAEFKCTFPDCGFVTSSQEKLDFHVKAHTNTKYKCVCSFISFHF